MRQLRSPLCSFKGLTWFATFITVLAVKLPLIETVKEGNAGSESAKRKSNEGINPKDSAAPYKSEIGFPKISLSSPLHLAKPIYILHRTRAGETVSQLLERYGLAGAEKQLWIRAMAREAGRRPLPEGREVHLYFAKPSQRDPKRTIPGPLKALELDRDDAHTLVWQKGIRGILFQRREKPLNPEVKTVSAELDSSLLDDGRKAGVHPTLLSQLLDIFTWDIDLQNVQKGDTFKILYEQRSRKDQESRAALRILAAEITTGGRKRTAVYFEKQKGQGNYYDLAGRSMARSFLRFPLEFISITSQFSESRFHPILRTHSPHMGIDFAAPRGTPVRAVGDGIISQAGWNGPYGKTVDIKHDSTYTSRYAHLHGFAPGIRDGTKVIKGQIIGYVGSTGRTTGPHLHFELFKDQQYIDPLTIDFPAEDSIEPDLQEIFENKTRTYLVELAPLDETAPQS